MQLLNFLVIYTIHPLIKVFILIDYNLQLCGQFTKKEKKLM